MKVRFEIEVENTEVLNAYPRSDDGIFIGADGKSFLVRDPFTGNLSVIVCARGIDEDHKSANTCTYMLPVNARIIKDDTDDEDAADVVGEKIVYEIHSILDEIREMRDSVLGAIENKQTVVTDGVSEETLLSALKIVSGSKNE